MIGTLRPSTSDPTEYQFARRMGKDHGKRPLREEIGAYVLIHHPSAKGGEHGAGGRWAVEHSHSHWRRDGLLTRAAAVGLMMRHMLEIRAQPASAACTTRAMTNGRACVKVGGPPSPRFLAFCGEAVRVINEVTGAEPRKIAPWLAAWYLRRRLGATWGQAASFMWDGGLLTRGDNDEKARNRSLMWDRYRNADATKAHAAELVARVDQQMGVKMKETTK